MTAKVKLTERALTQRINRVLCHHGKKLCLSKGWNSIQAFGRFYVINLERRAITDANIDLNKLGHELGCLAAHEELG